MSWVGSCLSPERLFGLVVFHGPRSKNQGKRILKPAHWILFGHNGQLPPTLKAQFLRQFLQVNYAQNGGVL